MTALADSALRAMQIGVLGTIVLHLSKGMMRHGVTLVQRARSQDIKTRRAAWVFYTAAIILNHTNPVWIIWANLYAAPAYYTSMYGIGLIALFAYSVVVLRETILARHVLGAMAIVIGTVALGTVPIRLPVPMIHDIDRSRALTVLAGTLLAAFAFLAVQLTLSRAGRERYRVIDEGLSPASDIPQISVAPAGQSRTSFELAFGITAGLLAASDPLLKAIGQASTGASTVLPTSPGAWLAFVASFVAAFAAFLVTNWGYFYGCRAAVMIAAASATYVTIPIVVQLAALPGFMIGGIGWFGVVAINLGVLGITIPRRRRAGASEAR